jgi:hypothetical protein
MYPILDRAHSGLRWIVLFLLVAAIFTAFQSWKAGRSGQSKIALFAMIFVHVQLLLGFSLYFISPYVVFESGVMKNALLRFYTVEHITMMLLAIVLITLGYSRAKKAVNDSDKGKNIFWYYLVGLLLILAAIPWPFREGLGGNWF